MSNAQKIREILQNRQKAAQVGKKEDLSAITVKVSEVKSGEEQKAKTDALNQHSPQQTDKTSLKSSDQQSAHLSNQKSTQKNTHPNNRNIAMDNSINKDVAENKSEKLTEQNSSNTRETSSAEQNLLEKNSTYSVENSSNYLSKTNSADTSDTTENAQSTNNTKKSQSLGKIEAPTDIEDNKNKSHIASDLSMEEDVDPRFTEKDRKPLIRKMKAPDKTALDIKKEIVPEKKRKRVSGVSMDNIIVSIKSLSAMLKASLPLAEAVKILAEQSTDANLRSIFYTVIEDIHNGSNLYESLSTFPKVFNPMVISVIETGEKGGILEKNLIFLADFLKKEHELSKKIKGALMYPMIILGLAVVEFVGMIFFILPKLESLFTSFPNVPAFTKSLISAAGFIRLNWIYILAGIVVVIFVLLQILKTKKGKRLLDWLAIKVPVIKKLTVANVLATFSRTIGLLLGSGIHISKALKIATTTVHNGIYSDIIMEIYNDAKEGQNISATLKQYYAYFPISFIKLIEVGEVSGTLEDNLLYLNEHYSQQVDEISDNFATFIEPILLILIGVVIGLLTITMITPLYQFVSSINS